MECFAHRKSEPYITPYEWTPTMSCTNYEKISQDFEIQDVSPVAT